MKESHKILKYNSDQTRPVTENGKRQIIHIIALLYRRQILAQHMDTLPHLLGNNTLLYRVEL